MTAHPPATDTQIVLTALRTAPAGYSAIKDMLGGNRNRALAAIDELMDRRWIRRATRRNEYGSYQTQFEVMR